MSEVKANKCPSCGGNLLIDADKQICNCPSCGNTYGYEYFKEIQLREKGEYYLSRKEFKAATDAFSFLLQKDPHDFFALRGLLLAGLHMKDINAFLRKDDYAGFTYDHEKVNSITERSSDEDRGYFEEFGRLCSEMEKLSAAHKEHEQLLTDHKRLESKLKSELVSRAEYNRTDKDGVVHEPKGAFITMCCVTGFFALAAIAMIIAAIVTLDSEAVSSMVILVLIFGLVALVFGIVTYFMFYPLYNGAKLLDESIRTTRQRVSQSALDIEKSEKYIHQRSYEIRNECKAFIERDTQKLK